MTGFLDALPEHYRVILCDLWGCVHDGVAILPGVIGRLDRWRDERRQVIFLTNAPRPSRAVVEQLAALGLPEHLNGQVVSSGMRRLLGLRWRSASVSAPSSAAAPTKRAWKPRGLRFFPEEQSDTVVCTGFDERGFDTAIHVPHLRRLAERKVEMLCVNPDRLVHRGGHAEPCAGAIADAYQAMGGSVQHFGKPYPHIYDHAISRAAVSDRTAMLAVGDSIATDFVGAANAGIDFVFVAGGIDAAAYRADAEQSFARAAGLRSDRMRPVGIVPGLG